VNVLSDDTVRIHAPVPVQAPDQPVKMEPAAGVAVRVNVVSSSNTAAQVLPQSMPAGTVRHGSAAAAGPHDRDVHAQRKFHGIVRAWFMVTWQAACVPAQGRCSSARCDPPRAPPVMVTTVAVVVGAAADGGAAAPARLKNDRPAAALHDDVEGDTRFEARAHGLRLLIGSVQVVLPAWQAALPLHHERNSRSNSRWL
jgi:hypothetical protein